MNELQKQTQFNLIMSTNPPADGIHTWIHTIEDIHTFGEVIDDGFTPDFTSSDVQNALTSGYITVFSSHEITPGVFVSPSRMEAESYAGDSNVFEKTVRLSDVAKIDMLQGMYAPIDE